MLNYIILFLTGILTKISDNIVDKKILEEGYAFIASFFTGLAFAYLSSVSVPFATLISAVLVSLLFAGKFDHKAHQITLGVFMTGIFAFGISRIDPVFFSLIFVASFFDEFMNDNFKHPIGKYRLLLELTCLAISMISLEPMYFVAIFSFDVGYILVEMFTKKKEN
jgi:hypothetical protein